MGIREYKEADFAAIVDIYAASKLDELRFEAQKFKLIPLNLDPQRLAAFHESELVVYEEERVSAYLGTHLNHIRSIFVSPTYRGKGIGRQLLEHAIAHAKAELSLDVVKSNFIAKNLYSQYGFKIVDEFLSSFDGIPVLVNTMKRQTS
jgi:putative acetyltransferase